MVNPSTYLLIYVEKKGISCQLLPNGEDDLYQLVMKKISVRN